jgi:hypothetical protein
MRELQIRNALPAFFLPCMDVTALMGFMRRSNAVPVFRRRRGVLAWTLHPFGARVHTFEVQAATRMESFR